jgi:predicted transcriptional regulator
MPMFIKMGLNGTGYLGHQESHLRAKRKRAARRKVLPGYPVTSPLQTPEDLAKYFGGDKIICLLCGKTYRTLAKHLQDIHEISADEYRQRYGIPENFSLSCQATFELHSEWAKWAIENGILDPTANQAALARSNIRYEGPRQKSRQKLIAEVANPKPPREPKAKRGSPEFREKMRARPQCQPEVAAERARKTFTGKKQSPEHVRKRLRRS